MKRPRNVGAFFMLKYKNHILLHVIVFLWGFTGILGKLINLDSLYIVWYRVIIAFLVVLLIALLLKKDYRVKSNKKMFQLFVVGAIVGLHWLTFYMSIQLSTASLGVLCMSTATLHVAWLEPLITKRPFSWVELILSLVVVYGIYYVSGDFKPTEYLALFYGLLSAFLAALFAVLNAQLVKNTSALKITIYEMLAAFLVLSAIIVFQGKMTTAVFDVSWSDVFWLLFLGVVCTAFAFLAIVDVVNYLGAFTVSLSINLEPIYTFFLAIIILNEHEVLNTKFYVGAALIIVVVIVNAVIKSQIRRKNNRLQKKAALK